MILVVVDCWSEQRRRMNQKEVIHPDESPFFIQSLTIAQRSSWTAQMALVSHRLAVQFNSVQLMKSTHPSVWIESMCVIIKLHQSIDESRSCSSYVKSFGWISRTDWTADRSGRWGRWRRQVDGNCRQWRKVKMSKWWCQANWTSVNEGQSTKKTRDRDRECECEFRLLKWWREREEEDDKSLNSLKWWTSISFIQLK